MYGQVLAHPADRDIQHIFFLYVLFYGTKLDFKVDDFLSGAEDEEQANGRNS